MRRVACSSGVRSGPGKSCGPVPRRGGYPGTGPSAMGIHNDTQAATGRCRGDRDSPPRWRHCSGTVTSVIETAQVADSGRRTSTGAWSRVLAAPAPRTRGGLVMIRPPRVPYPPMVITPGGAPPGRPANIAVSRRRHVWRGQRPTTSPATADWLAGCSEEDRARGQRCSRHGATVVLSWLPVSGRGRTGPG